MDSVVLSTGAKQKESYFDKDRYDTGIFDHVDDFVKA
jgi:hypothetical protein